MVTPKMSRKALENMKPVVAEVVPFECPFREFRDNELQIDTWGLGPAAFRAHYYVVKAAVKTSHEPPIWIDDQTQPLPRSAQHFLHGWIRAEDLAEARWNAEVLVFEDNDGGKMAISDIQLSHTQVLFRSSFCREVLSACFILERVESLAIEHQWEMFSCSFGQEGWRPKYHIYSPGTKPGGGTQHKPTLSKNGCYLVRLFYLGAWRCVWVNDYVPVDSNGAPLLPFSPLMTHPPGKPGSKHVPPAVTASVIYLWPLLLTKALLKLAAPDGNSDDSDGVLDEQLNGFDIMHALTGCVNISYPMSSAEDLWTRITSEVPMFSWDDDDETQPSTIKSRSTKKSTAKELANVVRRNSLTYIDLVDTKDCPPYQLPGITPGHEMNLLVTMARDLPLKKPLPEPEVALWKYYRWVDWAKRHGLYAMYACPRTRFLKVNGLMKLSYAPHLLDVQSTESITYGFIEEHGMEDTSDNKKKKDRKTKDQTKSAMNAAAALQVQQMKEELREWVQFMELQSLVKCLHVLFYPSMFNFASAGSNPPMRLPTTKGAVPKATDITAPKGAPLYFQLDGPEVNKIKISLSSLHPRVLANCGSRIPDYVEKSYVVLEKFEWFNDAELPVPSGFATTRRYQSLELDYPPGRHYFRVWVHARVNWSLMVISESTLLLGTKDVIQGAAVRDCPWASKFLSNLGLAFLNWTKVVRSTQNVMIQADREFFSSYAPDLPWDKKVVGYDPHLRHWMFRQALQSRLQKSLGQTEWKQVVIVLRKYFCDPNFGFTEKPRPVKSLRNIADLEVCDCVMPEVEETEIYEEQHLEETEMVAEDEKPLVDSTMMAQLLTYPEPPITSQVCELATDQLQCGLLKEEREKVISRHEAAIAIQAHWRGTWARKCLNSTATFTPEILKYVQDQAFGTVDSLSMLMNEFFTMFPGAKYAYSVSSALSGVYGFQQHTGTTPVFPKCVWVPYFQGVFYCHAPVKVHFDVHSNLGHSMLAVYDNDTSAQLPQAFNSHITYDFNPNVFGYTVVGHGTLNRATGINQDAHWQLTVMSNIDGAFHVCDNEDPCKALHIPYTQKIHVDEIFFPNRRNILGGIHLSVTKHESVSFRAAASSPEVEMVAILRTTLPNGESVELGKCAGKGEIYWPFIRLEPHVVATNSSTYTSARDLNVTSARSIFKTGKQRKVSPPHKSSHRSLGKMKQLHDSKFYSIEVTCPSGWPLTLAQWKRVDEVINSIEFTKVEQLQIQKKLAKEKEKPTKIMSAKEKERVMPLNFGVHQPLPGDAFVELECAFAVGGGVVAKRDDERDQNFVNARKAWDAREHGRNARGAQIRKQFREEFLVIPPPEISESTKSGLDSSIRSSNMDTDVMDTLSKDAFEEMENEEPKDLKDSAQGQGPTPATESGMLEMSVEAEEEAVYLTMPELLRDNFKPLNFLPLCMKEKESYDSVIVTSDMAKAAAKERQARIEAAKERMKELQLYNEEHVLGRQKDRCFALEKLFVDANMCPELMDVMEQRETAIQEEVLTRTLSATKKKMDAKKLEVKKTDAKKTEGRKKQ